MTDVFARIVLAHLFGDYLFQTKSMALSKTAPDLKGWSSCAIHCLVYTAIFALFFKSLNPIFLSLVFLSHFPIDRWSLGQKWLDLIKGRSILKAFESRDKYRDLDISFSCLVYAVVDNTLHIFLIWTITKLF